MDDNVLSPRDVKRFDVNSLYLGVDTILLMENAGKSVADFVAETFPDRKRVLVVCGPGNNGGDGFVAARHLASHGFNVTVVLIGTANNIRTDIARKNWSILKKMIFSVKLVELKDSTRLSELEELLKRSDIVIDAIFGVGIRGAVRGFAREIIELINSLKKNKGYVVIAVDVPSGLDTFDGKVYGSVIKADYTITFHGLKKGLSEDVAGKIIVRGIGIPPEASLIVGPGDVLNALKKRTAWSHKGDFGKILIIGGSNEFSGAPALAALASLRTGADLVVIAAPESVASVIRSFSPDLIVRTLPGDYLNTDAIEIISNIIDNFDTVVLGPGIGLQEEPLKTAAKLSEMIIKRNIPLLIDADGLKAIAKYGIPSGNVVITPHAGEFSIIFNQKPSADDLEKRASLVREMAKKHNVTILLKGHIDIISDGSIVKFNTTGNPGMTVGGTGDVLSGITATLLAQCKDPLLAACAGAFISGAAGDMAFKEKGYELIATDVVEKIPDVLSQIRSFR